jgi:hypothetical protein
LALATLSAISDPVTEQMHSRIRDTNTSQNRPLPSTCDGSENAPDGRTLAINLAAGVSNIHYFL